MTHKSNKLRKILSGGGVAVGTAVHSWSPNVVEIAGHAGLDFIRIDGEHSWRRDFTAENLIRAAVIADICPVLRVDKDDPYLVRKALEIGAGAVLVPNIVTRDDCEAVVRAAKFPPKGIRGYAGDCFSADWGTDAGKPWVEWSDAEPMVGVMIEHVDAMPHLDEILAVDGLDWVMFGAADYSLSLGLRRPERYNDKVLAATEKVIAVADKAGVPLALPCEIENAERYYRMGVRMLEILSDLLTLHETWVEQGKAVRALKK
ncbi:MAG: hypothetical protein FVQ81_05185 [Candidatus Glassbacteria bacterium]|nr:hypothetical protein [Candidatus Glassbacteria bacterium]